MPAFPSGPRLARLRTLRSTLTAAGLVMLAMTALTTWFVVTGRGNLSWADPESAHRWLYVTPLTRLGDFTLGILAARLYAQTRGHVRLARVGGLLAAVAGLVILALMAWPSNLFSAWSWDLAYALPAAVLIFGLAAAPLSLPARMLSIPIVVLLGEASYAFYLVHMPALSSLAPVAGPLRHPRPRFSMRLSRSGPSSASRSDCTSWSSGPHDSIYAVCPAPIAAGSRTQPRSRSRMRQSPPRRDRRSSERSCGHRRAPLCAVG